MVDITEISAMVAAAGVLVGVAYYALEIRQQSRMIKEQNKIGQTDLIIRLYSFTASKEFLEAWDTLLDREIKSIDDYKKKYGNLIEVGQVYGVFEELGILLKRRLIDLDLIDDLMGRGVVTMTYEKMEPFNEKYRKERGDGEITSFEYLYNEMKKREERGIVSG